MASITDPNNTCSDPPVSRHVLQRAAGCTIDDEDGLDLALLISDTHSGGTAMAASGLWWHGVALNQLLKNIRVAFEKPVSLADKQELCAVDYDQSNTKTNVKQWLLDMAGDGVGSSSGRPGHGRHVGDAQPQR